MAEQVEVLTLTGNISRLEGDTRVHAHVVLGRRHGSTIGGHLMAAVVRPTLELVVTEARGGLVRRSDPPTGLPLLAL